MLGITLSPVITITTITTIIITNPSTTTTTTTTTITNTTTIITTGASSRTHLASGHDKDCICRAFGLGQVMAIESTGAASIFDRLRQVREHHVFEDFSCGYTVYSGH